MNIFGINSPETSLKGVTDKVEIPKYSHSTFANHKFQLTTSKYLNSNFGFSVSLVKFYNQVEFSLFQKITNLNVILGKNNYLFEPWYINAYYGNDFVGKTLIKDQVNKLLVLDSVFKSKGKTLIIALAPGKANIYPEAIPEYKRGVETELTNYKYYHKKLKETKLKVLDFNQWFLEMKPSFKRHLFTKSGTHWSEDIALHSLDSLIRFFESVSGDTLNNIIIGKLEQKMNPTGADDDLLRISNLLFEQGFDDYYYYSKYKFERHHKTNKRLITIGDSFFWNMYAKGLTYTFKEPQFWYYFNTVYKPNQKAMQLDEISFIDEIERADYILLMASPSPIDKFGWGFIDDCYDEFTGGQKNIEIQAIISKILSDNKWTKDIRKKAKEKNITFKEMLWLDAEYVYNQSHID